MTDLIRDTTQASDLYDAIAQRLPRNARFALVWVVPDDNDLIDLDTAEMSSMANVTLEGLARFGKMMQSKPSETLTPPQGTS